MSEETNEIWVDVNAALEADVDNEAVLRDVQARIDQLKAQIEEVPNDHPGKTILSLELQVLKQAKQQLQQPATDD